MVPRGGGWLSPNMLLYFSFSLGQHVEPGGLFLQMAEVQEDKPEYVSPWQACWPNKVT